MDYFNDLEFVCCGRTAASSSAYTRHYFDGYYGLQFINRGRILLQVDDSETLMAQAPVCFFTCPGAAFSYSTPQGESRDHCFVCFKGDRTLRYTAGGLLPAGPEARFFQVSDPEKLLSLWKQLQKNLRQSGKISHAEAVLLLEKMLLTTAANAMSGKGKTDKLADLASRIADAPGREWDFKKEAADCGISLIHFRRLFLQATGMPLWHYVLDCRIRYAAQLLSSSDKLVKEIASDCGFNSVFHFSREFKKIMKKSPENFRKSI
ncbi:MAG: helix-turn-helix transcriptional regulator [Lentisphaeria bacterium]|nr:helix-turn-helix transcriptional regulator [Lentisphaeria bacterium]